MIETRKWATGAIGASLDAQPSSAKRARKKTEGLDEIAGRNITKTPAKTSSASRTPIPRTASRSKLVMAVQMLFRTSGRINRGPKPTKTKAIPRKPCMFLMQQTTVQLRGITMTLMKTMAPAKTLTRVWGSCRIRCIL